MVSFDRDLSDFLFINSDFGSGDTSYTGFAYLVNGSGSVGASAYDIVLSSYSYDAGDGVWSLVNTSAVPDGGSTVGLLGLALIGFAAMRRQLAAR